MTQEEQRIAIATFCGWSNFEWAILLFGSYTKENKRWDHQEVPDYPNDLNAMHEAERQLTRDQRRGFVNALWDMVGSPGHGPYSISVEAHFVTAAQRAEAFLKTLNLWTS